MRLRRSLANVVPIFQGLSFGYLNNYFYKFYLFKIALAIFLCTRARRQHFSTVLLSIVRLSFSILHLLYLCWHLCLFVVMYVWIFFPALAFSFLFLFVLSLFWWLCYCCYLFAYHHYYHFCDGHQYYSITLPLFNITTISLSASLAKTTFVLLLTSFLRVFYHILLTCHLLGPR